MTDEEIEKRIHDVASAFAKAHHTVTGYATVLRALVRKAIDAAVASEREACAVVVEDTDVATDNYSYHVYDNGRETLRQAAEAIRARTPKEGGSR